MRTLQIAETLRGGIGTYLNLLAPRLLSEFGAESTLLVTPDNGVAQIGDVPPGQVRSFRHSGRTPATFARMAAAIVRAAREHRPEVIHLHSTFAGLIGRSLRLAGLLPQPIVYCSHGWAFNIEMAPWKQRAARVVELGMTPFCDVVTAISAFDHREGLALGIRPEKLRLIRNGVAAQAPLAAPSVWDDARLRVLFVGRLDRQKGFDLLVEAAASLQDRISVRVAGTPIIDARDVAPPGSNVTMLGWLPPAEIEAQMLACDVLVVPSRWEGFGLVVIEAMRAGKAVVASAVGGIPEIVRDGDTGVLLRQPSVAALIETLAVLQRSTCEAMGRRGRERFLEEYSFDFTYGGLTAVYRDLGDAVRVAAVRP